MHPLYSIPLFVTSLAAVSFGLFVFLQNTSGKLNRLFALLSLSVAWWSMGFGFVYCSTESAKALGYARLAFFGVVFIPTLFYHFMLEFLGERKTNFLRLLYVLSFCFLIISQTALFMNGMYVYFWGFYPKTGPFYSSFIVFFYSVFLTSLYNLFQTFRHLPPHARTELRTRQIKTVAIAYFVATLSVSDYFPNYGIKIYPFAYLAALGWLATMVYAVFKHRLMDVRVIIRKTAVYSLVSAILISLYVGIISVFTKTLEGLFTHAPVFSSAIAAATIALLFHPLQLYVQHWLDRRFPRESLDQSLLREATSDFVHEIKRPLANISMPAQLALKDLEDFGQHSTVPRLREKLEFILRESLEAGQTIEAIRAISSRSAAQFQPINLKELFQKLLDREQARILESRITLGKDFPESETFLNGDAKQLEIAFGNIIKNAIEALQEIDAASRRLRVAIYSQAANLVVDIEDTGKGIAKADLASLFDPWFSTKGASGMGIGLFLAKEIFRLHNAAIHVESQVGIGSRFRITFPNTRKREGV